MNPAASDRSIKTAPAAQTTPDFRPEFLSHAHWMIPAALVAAATAVIRALDWDRAVARPYYSPAGPPGWPQGFSAPWSTLYQWGILPSVLLGVASLGLLAAGLSARQPHARRMRQRWTGLVLLLSLLLGPLVLVNGALQEYWGRPRPRQVQEFGGDRAFVPVLEPTGRRGEPSFPSGHAGAGFAVLLLYFVLRERQPRLAALALAAGVGLGAAMGWARITQGGHWLSDVLWAGAVVYFSGWAMAQLLTAAFRHGSAAGDQGGTPAGGLRAVDPWRAGLAWGVAAPLAAALLAYGVLMQPIQRMDVQELPLPPAARAVRLELSGPVRGYLVQPRAGGLRVFAALSGRGAPWTAMRNDLWVGAPAGGELPAHYSVQVRGEREELNLRLVIGAPPDVQVQVQVQVQAAPPRAP